MLIIENFFQKTTPLCYNETMQIVFLFFQFIIGACFGSFLCCQARRLRLKELGRKPLGRRSVCNHCHRQLKWSDNIPIVSWLCLRGRCHKCGKKIGLAELLSELGTAISFLLLSIHIDPVSAARDWPLILQISTTVLFVLALVLIFLAIYDGLYGELPTIFLVFAIILACVIRVFIIVSTVQNSVVFSPEYIWKPLASIAILGGIYLVLYLISRGKWVGDGDWMLGTAIGIALYEPWLALIALFLANFIACIVMYPVAKSKKSHKIHFGPFLVIAFIITISFSKFFLSML